MKNTNLTSHHEAILYLDSYKQKTKEVGPIKNKKTASYQKHYHPAEQAGICVVRRKGETDDELLKRFRKRYSKSGLSKELRDRMYYEKPCDKRRRKKMQSIRLVQREQKKMEEMKERYEKFKQKRARIASKKKRKEYNQNDTSRSRQNNSRSYESNKDQQRVASS